MATIHDSESISRSDEARFLRAERMARLLERGGTLIVGTITQPKAYVSLDSPAWQWGLRQLTWYHPRTRCRLTKTGCRSAEALRLTLQTADNLRVYTR
jgi:hypothetical protein